MFKTIFVQPSSLSDVCAYSEIRSLNIEKENQFYPDWQTQLPSLIRSVSHSNVFHILLQQCFVPFTNQSMLEKLTYTSRLVCTWPAQSAPCWWVAALWTRRRSSVADDPWGPGRTQRQTEWCWWATDCCHSPLAHSHPRYLALWFRDNTKQVQLQGEQETDGFETCCCASFRNQVKGRPVWQSPQATCPEENLDAPPLWLGFHWFARIQTISWIPAQSTNSSFFCQKENRYPMHTQSYCWSNCRKTKTPWEFHHPIWPQPHHSAVQSEALFPGCSRCVETLNYAATNMEKVLQEAFESTGLRKRSIVRHQATFNFEISEWAGECIESHAWSTLWPTPQKWQTPQEKTDTTSLFPVDIVACSGVAIAGQTLDMMRLEHWTPSNTGFTCSHTTQEIINHGVELALNASD